jgi:hypothetical protein
MMVVVVGGVSKQVGKDVGSAASWNGWMSLD